MDNYKQIDLKQTKLWVFAAILTLAAPALTAHAEDYTYNIISEKDTTISLVVSGTNLGSRDIHRYLYEFPSVDAEGKPVNISGAVWVPKNIYDGTAPCDGVVLYNHYTHLSADERISVLGEEFCNGLLSSPLKPNYIFVISDYLGFGITADRPQAYLCGETNARNSLSYTYVKAPANGQVGNLPYRTGDLVGPQIPTPLTTVSDNSEMWVYFSMTENQFLGFSREFGSINEAARQMPAVSLQLKDGSKYEAEGRIESVSAVIDRSTGTATCKAVFPNKKGLLHSGLSGTVLIPTTYKDVIIIPQSAAVSQQDKYIVYKVGKDGMAEGVLVKVAPINDGKEFIVTEGLNAGDEILATGAGLVRPGTKLK